MRDSLATFGGVEEVLQGKRGSAFFGRGKLMLTGEYLVLDGATALAVPTKVGQELSVELTEEVDVLHWVSFDFRGAIWLEEAYSRRGLATAPAASEVSASARVARLLHHLFADHPRLWPAGRGLRMTARLGFDRSWGFGSSASLAYCLAAFGGSDAFALNQREFGGSGYDIATAGAEAALLYRLEGDQRHVASTSWNPSFLSSTYLVHQGDKQDSRAGIRDYRAKAGADLSRYVTELDALTQQVLTAPDRAAFAEALRRHEALVGYVTHQTPIGRTRFQAFPGVAKSLGAWGGDFALLIPEEESFDVTAYCQDLGLTTVFPTPEVLCLPEPPETSLKEKPLVPEQAGDWLVFFYGPLAEPRMDNEWLAGHPHTAADLPDFAMVSGPVPMPVLKSGGLLPGTVVYLSPSEVRQLDLHPEGRGYRRTQVWVRVNGQRRRALMWLPFA